MTRARLRWLDNPVRAPPKQQVLWGVHSERWSVSKQNWSNEGHPVKKPYCRLRQRAARMHSASQPSQHGAASLPTGRSGHVEPPLPRRLYRGRESIRTGPLGDGRTSPGPKNPVLFHFISTAAVHLHHLPREGTTPGCIMVRR